jgi:hypothetical protein
MTEKKETNIGLALNRRLEIVIKNRDKIEKHEKRLTALEKVIAIAWKQQEYLIAVEKRLVALETQPSIEGEKLLNYIAETNKDIKTLYDQYNNTTDTLYKRTELDSQKIESAE